MTKAINGDKVSINFIGKTADGAVIDTTTPEAEHSCSDDTCEHEAGPFELVIGEENFYIPVEQALIGMQPGDRKTVTISPDDAFGDYDPENVFTVPRDSFPEDIDPVVGMGLEVTGEGDEVYMVTVVNVSETEVSLDTNHPLAGEELTYEIELLEIL